MSETNVPKPPEPILLLNKVAALRAELDWLRAHLAEAETALKLQEDATNVVMEREDGDVAEISELHAKLAAAELERDRLRKALEGAIALCDSTGNVRVLKLRLQRLAAGATHA